jgi:hypothetical protein
MIGHSAEDKMLGAAEVKVNAAEELQNGKIFVDKKEKAVAYGVRFNPHATPE